MINTDSIHEYTTVAIIICPIGFSVLIVNYPFRKSSRHINLFFKITRVFDAVIYSTRLKEKLEMPTYERLETFTRVYEYNSH